jgi:hypothetical protein
MDRLKFNEMKRRKKKTPNFFLKDCVGLERRSLFILYFDFEYKKHRTIKRDAKDSMKVSKCLFEMPTIKERHKITHLCT